MSIEAAFRIGAVVHLRGSSQSMVLIACTISSPDPDLRFWLCAWITKSGESCEAQFPEAALGHGGP